jgi:hypothetical protein
MEKLRYNLAEKENPNPKSKFQNSPQIGCRLFLDFNVILEKKVFILLSLKERKKERKKEGKKFQFSTKTLFFFFNFVLIAFV